MTKVKFTAVQSATVRMDNSSDESKVFDIEAKVNIGADGSVVSVDNGIVKKDSVNVGGFSSYSPTNMSMNYNGVEESEQVTILTSVNEFVATVREYFTEHQVTIS